MRSSVGCAAGLTLLLLASPVDAKPKTGLLFSAAKDGNLKALRRALKSGVDVNARSSDKASRTALMYAAAMGHAEAVKILLAAGADANLEDNFGESALLDAAREGYVDVLKLLLAAKADLRAEDNFGNSALRLAITHGSTETVATLTLAGMDVNAEDKDGWTPLMYAAVGGRADVVRTLLAAGADPSAVVRNQTTTALSLALTKGNDEAADIIKDAMRSRVRKTVVAESTSPAAAPNQSPGAPHGILATP